MIRTPLLVWALAATLVPAHATTLRRASLDDLIRLSSSVIRGRVVASSTSMRGAQIDTHYTIQVIDRWKGADAAQVDVQIPGGVSNGVEQDVAGAPQLAVGAQYVFFLWTGPSGANYSLGLSQGVLVLTSDDSGNPIVVRQASEALTLDAGGAPVTQDPLQMKLSDFANRVTSALKGGASAK